MKKKVLITGAVSLLGKYISQALKDKYNLFGTSYKNVSNPSISITKHQIFQVDITNKKRVNNLLETVRPDVLIHLAALSDIDYCEKHPTETHLVNVIGTQNLVSALVNKKTHFVFTSSSMVFDGTQAPYQETDLTSPKTVYGKTKVLSENALRVSSLRFSIVRCSTLFGWNPESTRDNILTTFLKALKSNKALYLVKNQYFNPIYAQRASLAIKSIITNSHEGIFHLAGKDIVTRFGFIQQLIEAFQIKPHPSLIPVADNYFTTLVKRPRDTTLKTKKMQTILKIIQKSLRTELKLVYTTQTQ